MPPCSVNHTMRCAAGSWSISTQSPSRTSSLISLIRQRVGALGHARLDQAARLGDGELDDAAGGDAVARCRRPFALRIVARPIVANDLDGHDAAPRPRALVGDAVLRARRRRGGRVMVREAGELAVLVLVCRYPADAVARHVRLLRR